MTRDELERCEKLLTQGVDLGRETVQRLVKFALGQTARTHLDGCAWWRGAGCSCCEDDEADMKPAPVQAMPTNRENDK